MNLKRWINGRILRAGYRISRIRPAVPHAYLDVLDLLLARVAAKGPVRFLQIGANDGLTRDPLHALLERYPCQGVMVEPQPRVFARLVENLRRHPGLRFENALIGASDGQATLHVPKASAGFPDEVAQAASLDRLQLISVMESHARQHGVPPSAGQPDDWTETIAVPSLTVASLLRKHGIDQLDLLLLDTMGYDFEIIRRFPFETLKPGIVHYEHAMLPRDEQCAAVAFLAERGYVFSHVEVDTIAVLNGPARTGEYAF